MPTFDEVAPSLAPVPPGAARIIVYRPFEPYQSLAWVPIFFNGATVGAVGPGHVILRDVAPAVYDIAPKSQGLFPNQDKVVALKAGEVVYAKIGSFISTNAAFSRSRPVITFVVTMMDPAVARQEIGPLAFQASRQKPRELAAAR